MIPFVSWISRAGSSFKHLRCNAAAGTCSVSLSLLFNQVEGGLPAMINVRPMS